MGRLTAAKQALPDAPEFPDALDYLWRWFVEILDGVAPNGMTAPAIGWRDLAAWCELTGERLEAWEARLLLRLSNLRVNILAEDTAKPGPTSR